MALHCGVWEAKHGTAPYGKDEGVTVYCQIKQVLLGVYISLS